MTGRDTLSYYNQFTGTMGYHSEEFFYYEKEEKDFLLRYVYTDGIDYLKNFFSLNDFQQMFYTIIICASYKLPMVLAHLVIEKDNPDEAHFIVYDDDLNVIKTLSVTNKGLTPGVYKMFMYNYVWLAASEY